jgi:hypothetical protein
MLNATYIYIHQCVLKTQMAEKSRFVEQLRMIISTHVSPFFITVTDLALSFSVDKFYLAKTRQSLHSAVFSFLRDAVGLKPFLVSVSSTLEVILSVYNGDERHIMVIIINHMHEINYIYIICFTCSFF